MAEVEKCHPFARRRLHAPSNAAKLLLQWFDSHQEVPQQSIPPRRHFVPHPAANFFSARRKIDVSFFENLLGHDAPPAHTPISLSLAIAMPWAATHATKKSHQIKELRINAASASRKRLHEGNFLPVRAGYSD